VVTFLWPLVDGSGGDDSSRSASADWPPAVGPAIRIAPLRALPANAIPSMPLVATLVSNPTACALPAPLAHRVRDALGASALDCLTDVVAGGGDPFEAAARDMAHVLDEMGLDRVRVLSRDGGAPAALAFAALYPHRVGSGLLISPRPPRAIPTGPKLVRDWVRMGIERPGAIVAVHGLLRRRAGVRLTELLMARLFSGHPADAALIADPAWRHAAVAELLTCGARTADGLSAEQTAYPAWSPPTLSGSAPWTVVTGGLDPLWSRADGEDPWRRLPGLRHVRLETGGRFIQDTHAREIAALF